TIIWMVGRRLWPKIGYSFWGGTHGNWICCNSSNSIFLVVGRWYVCQGYSGCCSYSSWLRIRWQILYRTTTWKGALYFWCLFRYWRCNRTIFKWRNNRCNGMGCQLLVLRLAKYIISFRIFIWG